MSVMSVDTHEWVLSLDMCVYWHACVHMQHTHLCALGVVIFTYMSSNWGCLNMTYLLTCIDMFQQQQRAARCSTTGIGCRCVFICHAYVCVCAAREGGKTLNNGHWAKIVRAEQAWYLLRQSGRALHLGLGPDDRCLSLSVAVCCSVLQCVAVQLGLGLHDRCLSLCGAVCWSVLPCTLVVMRAHTHAHVYVHFTRSRASIHTAHATTHATRHTRTRTRTDAST